MGQFIKMEVSLLVVLCEDNKQETQRYNEHINIMVGVHVRYALKIV